MFIRSVSAQSLFLSPPLITTIPRDISNQEIFYVGGKTDVAGASVVIYLQNLKTGETLSEIAGADNRGDWFNYFGGFLPAGNYLLWAQTKSGDEMSPQSPRIQVAVRSAAIQLGTSRLSYETLYLIFVIILLIAVLSLGGYVVFHSYRARRKHVRFMKEVGEAEESVRRGFAILRRDIKAELTAVKKTVPDEGLSQEEKQREEQLLRDLALVEKYVGKEVWDVKRVEPQGDF